MDRVISPKKQVKIGVVGKYIELQDAYKIDLRIAHSRRGGHDTGSIWYAWIDANARGTGLDRS